MTNTIDFEDQKTLIAIEFSVESKMKLDTDEQVTIIAHPDTIHHIRLAIAKGKIFSKIYSRIIFNEDDTMAPQDLVIIPDHVIEEIIQEDIKKELDSNEEVKSKMQVLNQKLENISEDLLYKISQAKDEELSKEELELKNEIQFAMLDVGMNLDLQFSDISKQEEKIDHVIDKISTNSSVAKITIGGKDE